MNFNKNLLLINQLLKNAQVNYPDNYYFNKNINNIILKYYESEDKIMSQILNNDIYRELTYNKKEEQEYKNEISEINKIKINENNNIINDANNKITMIYKINKEEKNIKILGKEFVTNNKNKYKLLINRKEYDICECIEYDKFNE